MNRSWGMQARFEWRKRTPFDAYSKSLGKQTKGMAAKMLGEMGQTIPCHVLAPT